MCALFYQNWLGIKKSVISFVYLFCPNIGTKFREPYHLNHVIPPPWEPVTIHIHVHLYCAPGTCTKQAFFREDLM